ncbi:MAG: HD domain-containing protein [Bacteroidales bacterium]|nr:HD domain-containing protein [Bacteroidales bacterium]
MANVSEFTQADYDVINHDYAELYEAARKRCAGEEELMIVQQAFEFANSAHNGVRRRSGEPYMLHPIAVAKIVVEKIGLGCKSISAALLHDVVEDTSYTIDDIKLRFGDKIALLVDGLTKIKTVLDREDQAKEVSNQAENFRRILLTMNDDVRVVLIKLADRLHNCRTIEFMPEYKREKILSETMFIFIPLAHRLGLYEIKSEMEDIWLRYKEPVAFREISDRINLNCYEKEAQINDFIAPIEKALTASGFDFEIKKRVKTPYSIWHKMQTKGVSFDQIYDLYAVRIIFNQKPDEEERDQCYHIFSIITGIYRYKSDRMRDWVKHPKSNGYEALHCTLMSNSGIWVEVQIRSRRMDDIAEKGIAAHWFYKKEGVPSEKESEMDKWLLKIQHILKNPDVNALELLDIIHNDLVSTDIFVFTPKGQQRSIVKGATALDFAYQVHTAIGNKAVAAKVNMRLVPLNYVLHSGDQVEIITTQGNIPKREWLDFLVTRKARKVVSDFYSEEIQKELQAQKEAEDKKSRSILSRLRKSTSDESTRHDKYILAERCRPTPADPIVRFKRSDGHIVVHKKSCPVVDSLASKFGDTIVTPSWKDIALDTQVLIGLTIEGVDRTGLLNEISHYVSQVMNADFRKLYFFAEQGIFKGEVELFVHDSDELERLIKKISGIDGVQKVTRNDL